MQTQTSNTLHNAIMEAGGKDCPPMLAPGIDNDIYSIVDVCLNACEMWKAIERGKEIINSLQPIYDQEPSMVAEDDETSKHREMDKLIALISLSFKKIYKPTNNNLRTSSNTSRANQDNSPRINRSAGKGMLETEKGKGYGLSQGKDAIVEEIDQNDDDNDLAIERELLASLIEKLKCEIDESKNHNKFFETSNKVLIEKLKGEIEDFQIKNKILESSNNFFKEANNRLSKTNNLLYADYKKSEAKLARRNSKEYASQMELDCEKVKGDLLSYKMEYQKSCTKYTETINDLNQTISKMKQKPSAHQETISILSQQKEAQIRFTKLRRTKNLIKSLS
nr:hypothetical protein [Tanacetum cinerariifolium]